MTMVRSMSTRSTARRARFSRAAILAGILLLPATAYAKGHGDEGGHDNGRHLGWYKHGEDPAGEFAPANRYRDYPSPAYGLGGYAGGDPYYGGPWVGRRSWGGGYFGWQTGVIAATAAWGVAWGLGPRFAYYAPPVVYVPPPSYIMLPPVVVGVPWLDAPAPPVSFAVATSSTQIVDSNAGYFDARPEALLSAALPPPIVVMPPPAVMIAAYPPPVIFAPPAYALSVWPAIAFAPPLLAVAVLHDEWWSGSYGGRRGYYNGGYYASPSYAGGLYAASVGIGVGAAGIGYGRGFAPDRAVIPFFGRGFGRQDHGRHGEEDHGHGHGHGHD